MDLALDGFFAEHPLLHLPQNLQNKILGEGRPFSALFSLLSSSPLNSP
jgi:hypothetical protein